MTTKPLSFEVPFVGVNEDLSSHELICVYGLDDGALYRRLRSWLHREASRFLIFLEEDETHFLQMKETPWMKDPKVRLFFYQEGQEELFKEIAWEFLFLKFSFFEPLQSDEMSLNRARFLFSKVEYYHRAIDLVASDYRDMGVSVLKNMVGNLRHWHRAKLGQSLEGCCWGVPAIICGGGSSLKEQMPLLESLRDRAFILAAGSAAGIFSEQGIRPHGEVHFDPDPPRHRFLERDIAEVLHIYQNRFSSRLLDLVHAPLLWMSEGENYPLEKWLKTQAGIHYGNFDSGWTAANFGVATTLFLGCRPIIFVGMEFSSSIQEEGMDKVLHSEGEILYTKNDWIMSAEWLAALSTAHPSIDWINATPCGIDIPGVKRLDLKEVADTYLSTPRDLAAMVHGLVEKAESISFPQGIETLHASLEESYQRSHQACARLLAQWEKYYPKSPMESGEYALALVDLEQEVVYQTTLEPMWQVWKRPILRMPEHPLGQHLHRILFFKRVIDLHLKEVL